MAEKGVQLGFSCTVCQDLLRDPVTLSCRHSYCMKCIKTHWDGEDEKRIYSCPQCRQAFTPRPVLKKNTMLAALVEELKKNGLQADRCYAGAEDVACDVCTGRKLKACKSCLVCLASFCEKHIQPHYDSPQFQKHKLVEPSKKQQENFYSAQDEVKKMLFCTGHKRHVRVSAAAKRKKKQKELEVSQQNIQQRRDREKAVELLQQQLEDIKVSADKAVKDSEEMFTHMIRLVQKRSLEVEQEIRSQQQTEENRVKALEEKLEQEIGELMKVDAELKKLLETPDHNQFLHNYP